jgi:hypothetical protein
MGYIRSAISANKSAMGMSAISAISAISTIDFILTRCHITNYYRVL